MGSQMQELPWLLLKLVSVPPYAQSENRLNAAKAALATSGLRGVLDLLWCSVICCLWKYLFTVT